MCLEHLLAFENMFLNKTYNFFLTSGTAFENSFSNFVYMSQNLFSNTILLSSKTHFWTSFNDLTLQFFERNTNFFSDSTFVKLTCKIHRLWLMKTYSNSSHCSFLLHLPTPLLFSTNLLNTNIFRIFFSEVSFKREM